MVPRRADGCGLASTRYATVPLPCPDVPEVNEIQFEEVDADHVQSRVVSIETWPVPPAAGIAPPVVAVTWHRCVSGSVSDTDVEPHAAAMRATRRQATMASSGRARMTTARLLQSRCLQIVTS